MSIQHTKQETLNEVKKALEDIDSFYAQEGFLNWSGKTKKSDDPQEEQEYYIEIISKYLLKEEIWKHLTNDIKPLIYERGETGYNNSEKARKKSDEAKKPEGEEAKAKKIWEVKGVEHKPLNPFENVGLIIKHQLPLNAKDQDRAGRVDLVSYNEKDGKVYLLEFKREDSDETILRCALEAFTYSKQLNHEKFIKDFKESGIISADANVEIVPAIFVYKDSAQHKQFNKKLYPNTCKLIEKLGVKFFTVAEKNSDFVDELVVAAE